MSTPQTVTIRCSKCTQSIQVCEGCEESGCKSPVCYECLNVQLGQTLKQPHWYGD